jgi:CBS domain-containing protein
MQQRVPASVPTDLPLRSLAERIADDGDQAVPVVDGEGQLLGVVSADDLQEALTRGGGAETARELARPVPELRDSDPLERAAQLLGQSEEAGLPVLAAEGHAVVGWITHRDVLRAYLRATRTERADSRVNGRHANSVPLTRGTSTWN